MTTPPTPDPLERFDADVRAALARIDLVALDVDGVLTDGTVIYEGVEEAQQFDVRDGAGIAWLVREGVRVVWITGRGCVATGRRASELGATLYAAVRDKRAKLAEVQAELGIEPAATLAMGDDLPDLGLADRADVFCAPADARPEVRSRAAIVTRAAGGCGAVREVCEALLAARGRWGAIVDGAG